MAAQTFVLLSDLRRLPRVARWRVILYLGIALIGLALGLTARDDLRPLSDLGHALQFVRYAASSAAFHLGLLAAIPLVIAARHRAWSFLALAAGALAVAVIPEFPASRPRAAAASPPGRVIAVMSVNVLAFNRTVEPIIAEVLGAAPDVLLVQEYSPTWHAALQRALSATHAYHGVVSAGCFGTAIYTRLPLREPPRTDLRLGDWEVPQMRAVIDGGGGDVAVYNVHLVPPRNIAYLAEQRRQVADLIALIQAERLPVIIAGDFNFTPRMPLARRLAETGLIDAHQTAYRGRPSTWPVIGFSRYLPGIALDHILVSPGVEVRAATIGTGLGSDHRPITALLAFPF